MKQGHSNGRTQGRSGDRVVWDVSLLWDKVQSCFGVKEVSVLSLGDVDVSDLEGRRRANGGS